MRVLHVLQMSLPNMSGYSIRSKYIVEFQKKLGIEVSVITSPFQKGAENERLEHMNGVPYRRTYIPGLGAGKTKNKWLSRLEYLVMFKFLIDILLAAREIKPQIIHAHSSFFCGIPAVIAAKILSIPCVYEIRGIWEDSSVANGHMKENSFVYRLIRLFEGYAINNCHRLVVISESLMKEMAARGIDKEKITVIPNGVDCQKFVPKPKKIELLKKHNIENSLIIGYIGSIIPLEGLPYLIKAFNRIQEAVPKAKLLIVGDGYIKKELEEIASRLGVENKVIFTGKVPHEEIVDYYSIIDLFVLPRANQKVANLVTPLKPLEIMACGKTVLGSDVNGMKELIIDSVNGFLFKAEDEDDLSLKAVALLTRHAPDFAAKARNWVCQHRDWEKVIRPYINMYHQLQETIVKTGENTK